MDGGPSVGSQSGPSFLAHTGDCLIAGRAQSPLMSRGRDQEADVLQELLACASDKAYGRKGTGLILGSAELSHAPWVLG